jgi:hypothetical protein
MSEQYVDYATTASFQILYSPTSRVQAESGSNSREVQALKVGKETACVSVKYIFLHLALLALSSWLDAHLGAQRRSLPHNPH